MILHFTIVMDPDQNTKFPLHEAAREGKSMYYQWLLLEAMLTI